MNKTNGAGRAFLIVAGVVFLVIALGMRGASRYIMMFIGVTILAALLIDYQKIMGQLNGLGKAIQ